MNKEEINKVCTYAYIAGIIDGEGCFGLAVREDSRYKTGLQWSPYLTITNTDERLFVYLQKNLGVAPRCGHYGDSQLRYSKRALQRFLHLLIPYLHLKKEQAELMIDALKLMPDNTKRLFEIRNKISELNQKGCKTHRGQKFLNKTPTDSGYCIV